MLRKVVPFVSSGVPLDELKFLGVHYIDPRKENSKKREQRQILQFKRSQMESSEPFPTSKRDTKSRAETELSDAQKTVRDLALKIEEANSRAKRMQQKTTKQREQEEEEQKVSLMNKEDRQYSQVKKEIENIKHELGKLKIDMNHVLKKKKNAENAFISTSSKISTLSSATERIKKEIEELDEEHVLVELARIEAVKERAAIEAQRNEEANRYKTQLEEIKKKVEEILQHNVKENELDRVKETEKTPIQLREIIEELESAKKELADIKREGFDFMASMDVIRKELRSVREETARLEKEEEKRDLTIQTLNSKILKGKAKLESITATTEKANAIASNLSLTVEHLRAESDTAKKENELINEQIKNIKLEIPKTEYEIELSEERLEAAMEELETVKSSEFKALENLKNLIDSTVRARESATLNSSTITITNFEYDYLTKKAGGAEEIADKKVSAAQAWVEALKANEKEILMKIERAKREIRELDIEVEEESGEAFVTDLGVSRRRSVDSESNRWGQNGEKVSALPRRSVYKIGNMTPGKRGRSQKLLSPATRQAIKSASFTKKREKITRNLEKFLGGDNAEMDE